MIYAIAIIALWASAYLFVKWLAGAPETIHAPRAVDAYYGHGRQGSTDWDSIPENAQL